jgi:hypothetical protein
VSVCICALRLGLSSIKLWRSHLRVPKEMGVGLASTKRLRPHPSILEKLATQADNSIPARQVPCACARVPDTVRGVRVPTSMVATLSSGCTSCTGFNAIRSSIRLWRFQTASTLGAGFQRSPRRMAGPVVPAVPEGQGEKTSMLAHDHDSGTEGWLALSSQTGSFRDHDLYRGVRIPTINSNSAAR